MKTPKENRTSAIPIRFRPQEWEAILVEAKKRNIKGAELVRRRALRARSPRIQTASGPDAAMLEKLAALTNIWAFISFELHRALEATDDKLGRTVIADLKQKIESAVTLTAQKLDSR